MLDTRSEAVLTIINVLTASLVVYISLIERGDFDLAALVREAGVQCSQCRSGACAVLHGKWYRKQVTDLSTGAIYRQVPILRVIFCDGSSLSLKHAELWRGRYTVSSVLETTGHVLADGIGEALEWTMYAGGGEQMVSERTLRRWTRRVVPRLGPLSDYLGLVVPPEAVIDPIPLCAHHLAQYSYGQISGDLADALVALLDQFDSLEFELVGENPPCSFHVDFLPGDIIPLSWVSTKPGEFHCSVPL